MAGQQRPPGQNPGQQQQGGARQRILRIGVLLGGKIVEERLIRERVPVSIGQSMKNTFSIPVEGLPLELTLFAIDQGKYYLRFTAKMDGRLSDGGNVATLDQLRGKAQQVGEYFQTPLGEGSRGKLSLGDLTILFQFVTEPPRQPRPMLPASVRGTLADRIDPRLAVIIGASILFHFSFMIIALFMDVDTGDSIADRAYNMTFKQEEYTTQLEEPKPVPVPDKGSAGSDAGSAKAPEKKPVQAPPMPPTQKPDNKPAGDGRDSKDDVKRKEDTALAFADAMTSDSTNGKQKGDTNSRRPVADLGAQVQDAKDSGKQVAVGNNGNGRGSRGNGDARIGNGKGPDTGGTGTVQETGGGKGPESGPSGRISVSDRKAFDDSTLTPDVVLNKIMNFYMAGLKRCYKEYLKKDASARGKVSLQFTVNTTGRLTNPQASGVADEVSSCIRGQMGTWTFPVPKEKDSNEATEANFGITLQLVPD